MRIVIFANASTQPLRHSQQATFPSIFGEWQGMPKMTKNVSFFSDFDQKIAGFSACRDWKSGTDPENGASFAVTRPELLHEFGTQIAFSASRTQKSRLLSKNFQCVLVEKFCPDTAFSNFRHAEMALIPIFRNLVTASRRLHLLPSPVPSLSRTPSASRFSYLLLSLLIRPVPSHSVFPLLLPLLVHNSCICTICPAQCPHSVLCCLNNVASYDSQSPVMWLANIR